MLFRFYRPTTKAGKTVKFVHWHLNFYKYLYLWPLEVPSKLYNFLYLINISIYIFGIYTTAYTLFSLENYDDIIHFTEILANLICHTSSCIRNIYRFLNKNLLRTLSKLTYRYIYMSEEENQSLHEFCEKEIKIMFSMTVNFFTTLVIFVLPIIIYFIRFPLSLTKPYTFSVVFPYDAQSIPIYLVSNICMIHVTVMNICLWNIEDSFLYITLNYTYARYQVLHKELEKLRSKVLDSAFFYDRIVYVIKEQQHLTK